MNDYIVIKLSGNWIEKEKNKKRVGFLLQGIPNVEVWENAAVTLRAAKMIPKEELDRFGDEFEDHIKMCLSKEIGCHLEEHGVITFEDSNGKMDGYETTQILATLVVIKEGE